MDLDEITKLCSALKERLAQKEMLCAELDEINDEIKLLSEVSIPTAMDELGLSKLQLTSGETISCSLDVKAAIPKDRLPEAIHWLEKNGFQDLIKTTISIKYDRNERNTAMAIYDGLCSNGINAALEEKVHPATLTAFVKEQLKKGADLPDELLGIYQFNKTIIK